MSRVHWENIVVSAREQIFRLVFAHCNRTGGKLRWQDSGQSHASSDLGPFTTLWSNNPGVDKASGVLRSVELQTKQRGRKSVYLPTSDVSLAVRSGEESARSQMLHLADEESCWDWVSPAIKQAFNVFFCSRTSSTEICYKKRSLTSYVCCPFLDTKRYILNYQGLFRNTKVPAVHIWRESVAKCYLLSLSIRLVVK